LIVAIGRGFELPARKIFGWLWRIGKSIIPIIRDPSKSVQDYTVFSFDDLFFVPSSTPGSHIRAIREGDWTYAVYFGFDGAGVE